MEVIPVIPDFALIASRNAPRSLAEAGVAEILAAASPVRVNDTEPALASSPDS